MNSQSITGIVLAGGKSSRMGIDKALLLYKGISLLENALSVLEQVCNKVVISAPEGKYRIRGYENWPDELPLNSAMTGVYSCLKRSYTPVNVILTCDMPLMNAGFLSDMLACVSGTDAVIPVHDHDLTEPLCAVYTKKVIPSIEERIISGKFSMREWASSTNHCLFHAKESSNYHPHLFTNINRMEDFDLLVKS